MQGSTQRLLMCGVLASLILGCGTSPTGTKIKKVHPQQAIATPTTDPGPALPLGSEAEARELTTRTIAYVKGLGTYGLDMSWMQRKDGKPSGGLYEIQGRFPNTTRIVIKKGSGAGCKVLFTGGSKAKVRPDGFLGAITVNLDITDERLISTRGYTIAETDMKALMDMFGDPVAKVRFLGRTTTQSTVEVTGGKLLSGCAAMRVLIENASLKPQVIEFWDSKEAVVRFEIRNLRKLSASTPFEI